MADKEFSTDMITLVKRNRKLFLDGTLRDEGADIVISDLGRVLVAEKEKFNDSEAAHSLFKVLTGASFGFLSPLLSVLFITMYESGRQYMLLDSDTILSSSMERDRIEDYAGYADVVGLVITETKPFTDITFVAPSDLLLEKLAEKGWGTPGYTRPIKNQAKETQKSANTPQNNR
jgi:hypothetical protein